MILAVSIVYFLYILIKIYVSVMQAGFILKAKDQKPVLMMPSKFVKAARYGAKKEKISIVETIAEYVLFIFWIGYGLGWLDRSLQIENTVLKSVLFVDIFVAINYLVFLPFEVYKKFVLDEEFGFNRSTLKLFIVDQIKSAAIFLIFGSLVIAGVSYIMIGFEHWWIVGFLFIFGIVVLINAVYPTIIAPIFNKFTPLENEELKEEIEALLKKCGFDSKGVYVIDASKRDNRLNAYFGGLGKTKRVVLFDTLIKKLSKDELLAVLGHELGHFVHKDLLKNIFLMGTMLFALFFIFANLPQELYAQIGVSNGPYATIALFLLLSPVFFFFVMPLISLVSRKNEYAADRYSSEVTSAVSLRNALMKLVDENSHFPLSHPIYIFFYYSHPPILDRLKALGFNEDSSQSFSEALKERSFKEIED